MARKAMLKVTYQGFDEGRTSGTVYVDELDKGAGTFLPNSKTIKAISNGQVFRLDEITTITPVIVEG